MPDPASLLRDLIAGYGAESRLYELQGEGPLGELLIEAWSLREALNEPWELRLTAVSQRADLDVNAMIGRPATLQTTLADGSRHARAGIVAEAASEEADGGLARYRLGVAPWLALLGYTRRSQLWQDRSLVQIVESVFGAYQQHAAWSWAPDTAAHLAESPFANRQGLRSTTTQYRETDLAFVTRLLTEEGLVYRFEPDAAAPLGHKLVILADTPAEASTPADATSAAGLGGRPGIRFHRASSIEAQDTIQAFGGTRSLQAATTTVLSWDYKAKKAVAASVPTASAFGGKNAPRIESYDPASPYAYPSSAQAERAAVLAAQALEARHKSWLGRGTVRSFTVGRRFTLTQSPLDALDDIDSAAATPSDRKTFLLTRLTHAGINNLPKDLSERIAQRLDKHRHTRGPALLEPWVDDALRSQARASGYANSFEVIRAQVPWRPQDRDPSGAPLHPRPTAGGMQTATVVGAAGQRSASGADEIHTDALGRIKVQFHFQSPEGRQAEGGGSSGSGTTTSATSTWVRVLQRYAGAGMGLQFIPRIGHEVLVDFVEGDIDRPLVVGSLYDGRGEGGIPATPGGRAAEGDTSAFAQSSDHRPSAQGNQSGGMSPAWHGAAAGALEAGGQGNAAAMSGIKTKEFGGSGHNQLVFDDSDGQLRTQLATSQHATQLNLGHLVHQADNHRGSFRGLGFELRTDAYGSVRAKSGLLLSTYTTSPAEPAGDNAAGIALAGQMMQLAQTFNSAAKTHQTVQLAGHVGSTTAGQSALSDEAPPLQALHTVLKGMVDAQSPGQAQADAGEKNTGTAAGKVPHTTDPVVAIAAKAGLAVVGGQDVQFAAGEGIVLGTGGSSHWATGGAARLHTGQAIGILAGAVKAGTEAAGTGLTVIAGKGDVELQAQADTMQIAAKLDLSVQSKSTKVDWAAAKKITLATAGGASIVIEGGNITVQCPGTITVRAGQTSFLGPERESYAMPIMPRNICLECLAKRAAQRSAFVNKGA